MSEDTHKYEAGGVILLVITTLVVVFLIAVPAWRPVEVEDFAGHPAGTVVAGTLPGGGHAQGTLFENFTLSGSNNSGGPHALILFNSAAPTGGDVDLGAPNESFGGPGIGAGGEAGQPGQNDQPLGQLLIIAEDTEDVSPRDGLVDDPDDEAGGGLIRFDFDEPTIVHSVVMVDIDERNRAGFSLYNGNQLVGTAQASVYGDNSVESVNLRDFGEVTRLDTELVGSGAIARIEYSRATTAVERTTWGKLKSLFH
jgi:hypothetical protein